MLVVDASVVVAALTNQARIGAWAEDLLYSDAAAAPHFMPVEAANALRRLALTGHLSRAESTLAHTDLLSLNVQLHPYEPFGPRVWAMRHTVVPQDGWYVALAETLQVPLATIDERLIRASGPRCTFITPPDGLFL